MLKRRKILTKSNTICVPRHIITQKTIQNGQFIAWACSQEHNKASCRILGDTKIQEPSQKTGVLFELKSCRSFHVASLNRPCLRKCLYIVITDSKGVFFDHACLTGNNRNSPSFEGNSLTNPSSQGHSISHPLASLVLFRYVNRMYFQRGVTVNPSNLTQEVA